MLKPLPVFLAALVISGLVGTARAQTTPAGGVGIGTATPAVSALLDLTSDSKGLLAPRLTASQRAAIASPATGLLVYQTDGTQPGFWYYAATGWTFLNPAGDNLGNHTATQNVVLNQNAIYLTDNGGYYHQLRYGSSPDGPQLFGFSGGELGYNRGTYTPVLRWTSDGRVGIGLGAPTAQLDVAGDVRLRGLAAGFVTADASGKLSSSTTAPGDNLGNHIATQNLNLASQALVGAGADLGSTVGIGVRADGGLNIGQNSAGKNIYVGYQSGYSNSSGTVNTFSGYQSGYSNTTGGANTFNGYQSGYSNTSGPENTFSGSFSGYRNTIGVSNVFSGIYSGYNNTSGSANVFYGSRSGFSNETGSTNVFIGCNSGFNNTTGNSNVFIGYNAGSSTSGTLSNAIAIGYQAQVSQSNSLVLGGLDSYAVRVGIGVSAPTAVLDVNGSTRLRGLTAAGFVTTDASGNLSSSPAGPGDNLGNHSATQNVVLNQNAIYLTDNGGVYHQLRYGSSPDGPQLFGFSGGELGYHRGTYTPVLRWTSDGRVGIGTSSPAYPLDVQSTVNATVSNYSYLNQNGTGRETGTSSATGVGLRVAGRVVASEFNATSDARLKHVVGRSHAATDLWLLNKLRITDYTMRDRAQYGSRPFKKVIAQEVEQVFPQAVSQHTGFLPDVYQLARAAVAEGDSLLRLTLPAAAPAARAGQRLKLVGPAGEVVATVRAASGATLLVRGARPLAGQQVFVFGLEHADVRTVDYEALAMLNVSATQELARQLEALKQQNAALQAQSQTQATQATALAQRLQALEDLLGARASLK